MSSDGRPALVVGVLKELGEGRWKGTAFEQGQHREEGAGSIEDMPVEWGKRASSFFCSAEEEEGRSRGLFAL